MSTSLKNETINSLLVGLTGGIGSGKSTVAKIFQSLGVSVFNSDTVAKSIINNDTDVVKEIISGFGSIYNAGKLNTQKMAELVFKDKKALEKLNNIVHPKVQEYFEKWVEKNKSTPILVKEAAILIEVGAYKELDQIILVTAPEEIRIQRVIERDNVSKEKVLERIQAQLSDKDKTYYADFVINNDDNQMLIPQVLEIFEHMNYPRGRVHKYSKPY